MAGQAQKKRPNNNRSQRPSKKQKRQQEYHSDSESEAADEFDVAGILDSDDDIHNVEVDEAVNGGDESDSSGSSARGIQTLKSASTMKKKPIKGKSPSKRSKIGDGGEEEEEDYEEDDDYDDDDDDDDDEDEDGQADSDEEQDGTGSGNRKPVSKRNDPSAFATSISKILSTKLSSSKRSDPVLARSAAAHEAAKAAVDGALESKARRQLKEQKRRALEKGRVKDVLMAPENEESGEPELTTADIVESEKRLRKTAHRGVVKMFNAVRAAQVKAFEAERLARKEGIIGIGQRELKAKELSKKGFLELIASGGGCLKKDGLEEA